MEFLHNRSLVLIATAPLLMSLACTGNNQTASDRNAPSGVLSPTATGPALATTCSNGLFASANTALAEATDDPTVIRQRAVTLDVAQLERSSRLELNLFDDVCVVAMRDDWASREGVWIGLIEGVPAGGVVFVSSSGAVIGTVISPPRSFQIRYLRGAVHVVREVDPSKSRQD